EIYCTGPLLDTVQKSYVFQDGKHFVDMCCACSPAEILAEFDLFMNCPKNDHSVKLLKMFVEVNKYNFIYYKYLLKIFPLPQKYFIEPGYDVECVIPRDWKEKPPFVDKISDKNVRKWAILLNKHWKDLARKCKADVLKDPDQYSLIYVPNVFIVPFEHGRELHYWDSYWIVRGLLNSDMQETARGMIGNFVEMVRQFGYVPGCGRIYSLGRTNPPLLTMMMKHYVDVTKDKDFAIASLPMLELEHKNFLKNHEVRVKNTIMYQYRANSTGPRPEAYMDDLKLTEHIKSTTMKQAMFTELSSASESGQEFSSRWFVTADGTNRGTILDTRPCDIVPVELNAIIFRSCKILAEFNRKAGNFRRADEHLERACSLVKAIRDILWNDEAGIWLDYNLVNNTSRNYFCSTNFAPLWARAYPLVDTPKVSTSLMNYIARNELAAMPGGVPHTLNKKANEKWDYPNCFPPMMNLIIEGLHNLGTPQSKDMSKTLAHNWLRSCYAAYT
ncbi:hypothetical protein KR018_002495, partial [Drosophila ironensis]